jgi:hypothetical protein
MFLYIVPIVVFLAISLSMYSLSKDKEKNKSSNILIRNILPAIVISVLVFVFMKYRETIFNEEPMMGGNYFDN